MNSPIDRSNSPGCSLRWLGLVCLLMSCLPVYAQVETHVLANDQLSFTFTPELGGRGLAFSVPGYRNLLRVGEAVASDPVPAIAADGRNYPYLGHIIWIGPQSNWWRYQSLNASRREAAASWPPDPWTVLLSNELIALDPVSAVLLTPESPVSGLLLSKRYRLEGDSLLHEVEATNGREEPVAWDIWFNTRVGPETRVFVPISDFENDVRLETYQGPTATAAPEVLEAAYFDFARTGRFRAKAFIQPADGWIAAFSRGQLFVIEFELHPQETIHPEHGQVELYLDSNLDSGLLELEVHSPYRTLQPGEHMSAAERWRAWTSDSASVEEQLAELARRGYELSD